MQFSIDADHGNSIFFWMVADNPEVEPTVFVGTKDTGYREVSANMHRQDLVDLGLHASGMAGFRIDAENFPEIDTLDRMEIIDAGTLLPIYARDRSGVCTQQKVLVWSFLGATAKPYLTPWLGRFALAYKDVERLPSETVSALLSNELPKSMAVVGQLHWLRVRPMVERFSFSCLALLNDPHVSLARSLLWLKEKSRAVEAERGQEAQLLAALRDVDLKSDRALATFLKGLMDEDRLAFRSPVTRALSRNPGEDCRRQDVAFALQTLSHFELVCTDKTLPQFAPWFGDGVAQPPDQATTIDADFVERLRRLGPVDDYLQEDIALYHFVTEAVSAAQVQTRGGQDAKQR